MLQESAYKAYPEELDYLTEHNASMRVGYKIGYEAGANAVLEEIERIINENEDGCLALERIQLRLSELKER